MTAPKRKPRRGKLEQYEYLYRCQFCDQESVASAWKRLNDRCPKCGALYDAMLAQEGDD